ncbi:diguanylate cyclase with GAF sensor [Rhodospirillum rubrum ATCC 11170]|uniref:diguanylate cyclase n=2 Tax=Rhodospirillum rubrum TaxID=1085 RepID=Q2RPL8_RHORT|nr:diguanylate cyclase [Rhodospirillum rubrum]ABC23927.1 diguanylate cyclase with GAF sensor [Rhodospirillum rubrum ATCC 11170]MBK5955625.1 sensor domain-containing diguanylate cyclase [Rhodospirillum rubrum]QXG79871.1 diguanylate cyclase [Rhodospirillum rubrum]HAP99088.1 sensor domain-containing diguanylate cyclase [Rhodospirillum rubrum]
MSADRLLTCLAECSTRLDGADTWPVLMKQILALVGEASGATRTWVFQTITLTDQHVIQDHLFEHISEDCWQLQLRKRFRLFRTALSAPDYHDLVRDRQRGLPSLLVTAEIAPGFLKASLERQKTAAMLSAPILVEGQWWGTIGLDDCQGGADWNATTIKFLQTIAGLIAGSIHRERQRVRSQQVAVMERTTGGGLWELDVLRGDVWCSETLFHLLGYPPPCARLTIRRLLRHILPEDRALVMASARRCMREGLPAFRLDVRAWRHDRTLLWWELIIDVTETRPLDGFPLRMTGIVLEVNDRKTQELELARTAATDPLTGLANRRSFEALATRLLENKPGSGTLLVIDIDLFKHINDCFGHAAGDEVLRHLAIVGRSVLRDGDLIGRLGGEEFAVLLQMDGPEAYAVADRLCQAVREMAVTAPSWEHSSVVVKITISIGIAHPCPFEDPKFALSEALRRADRALYGAKKRGRNQICHDTEGRQSAISRDNRAKK